MSSNANRSECQNISLSIVSEITSSVLDRVDSVLVGKRREATFLLASLWAGGHVLIEDVPGVGKTTLAKTVARSLGLSFQRVQFTPDLVPADITGVFIFNQETADFEFRPGPLMHQMILADEINRASPKTQSSLLEAMEERQITVDQRTFALPRPFIVLATQNPVEYEGTFPLPEAQMDRFACRIRLGYPDQRQEVEMLSRAPVAVSLENIEPVEPLDSLTQVQAQVASVHVAEDVREYIVRLARFTREHQEVALGASPRACQHLMELARSLAAIQGRDYVIPDDVKEMLEPAWAHRLMLKAEAMWEGTSAGHVIEEGIRKTMVPRPSRVTETR